MRWVRLWREGLEKEREETCLQLLLPGSTCTVQIYYSLGTISGWKYHFCPSFLISKISFLNQVWLIVLIPFRALKIQSVLTYSHNGKSWRKNKSIPTFPRADGQRPEKHHLVTRREGKPMGRLWATAGEWKQQFERASNGMCNARWWKVAELNS